MTAKISYIIALKSSKFCQSYFVIIVKREKKKIEYSYIQASIIESVFALEKFTILI